MEIKKEIVNEKDDLIIIKLDINYKVDDLNELLKIINSSFMYVKEVKINGIIETNIKLNDYSLKANSLIIDKDKDYFNDKFLGRTLPIYIGYDKKNNNFIYKFFCFTNNDDDEFYIKCKKIKLYLYKTFN